MAEHVPELQTGEDITGATCTSHSAGRCLLHTLVCSRIVDHLLGWRTLTARTWACIAAAGQWRCGAKEVENVAVPLDIGAAAILGSWRGEPRQEVCEGVTVWPPLHP